MMLYSTFVVSFVALGEAYPLRNHQVAVGVFKEAAGKRRLTLSGNGGLKLNLAGALPPGIRGAFGDDEIIRFHDDFFPDDHPIKSIKSIKGVVFLDFDGTITVDSIWEILSRGQNPTWADGAIKKLGAIDLSKAVMSELGQFARLQTELGKDFSTDAVSGGDDERIGKLIELLQDLNDKHIVVMVISKGNVAVIRQILHDTGLLRFIAKTYGYKASQHGANDNDRKADAEHANFKGHDFMKYKGGYDHEGGKKGIIRHFMEKFHKEHKLDKNRAILVDDSETEIKHCSGTGIKTLKVSDRAGMSLKDMEDLKRMVEGWN